MKKMIFFILVLAVLYVVKANYFQSVSISQLPQRTNSPSQKNSEISIVVDNLDTPWAIAFLPDNHMLITERMGQVRLDAKVIATIAHAREIGEGGLLGIALHPDFEKNHFIYLYYTYTAQGDNTLNRVVRMTYNNESLSNEQIIVDKIPGASNHNGGRIKFGPDGFLYIATGDAQEPSRAQDTKSLAGKILRVTDEGKPAVGNPFNNEVFSYGHRNVQGLAWDAQGQLWATEHGRSGVQSGLDELNRILPGKNYGWPAIQGDESRTGMEKPIRNSGNTTWAPAGAAFSGTSIYFSGLKGQTLYEAIIANNQAVEIKEHFHGEYGRLREAILGPDGYLYITTSNKDGRGFAKSGDDKVIRLTM
jgi:glucose/arabinose dehydrogenase